MTVSALRVLCAAAASLVLAGGLAGSEGEDRIPNWMAPPFWTPSVHETAELADGRSRTAQGRTALAGGPTALPFISLFPCRLVDTRSPTFPAPLGGGYLPAATVRNYVLAGVCNVPANAGAISLNATVTNPAGPGFLVLWPKDGPFPPVSTLNYTAGQTIVNSAVVPLSADGGISVILGVSGGDVILDTNGYYAAVPAVTSLNALTGDVTLAAGSNVTLTPSGNTLTIASTGGSGGPPTGPAGGALSGTYPNPTLAGSFVQKAGDTMTGTLNLDPGNINLVTGPSTPVGTGGVITRNSVRFIHDFGTENTFVGLNAGNFSMAGNGNVGVGTNALRNNSSGVANAACGDRALAVNSLGSFNSALGYGALKTNDLGSFNAAVGYYSLYYNTTGSRNTAVGAYAVGAIADDNTGVGFNALWDATSGGQNTAVGSNSLKSTTTGIRNNGVGYNAGARSESGAAGYAGTITYVPVTTGSFNNFIGWGTGATVASVQNCTAVGTDAYCDADNQVRLGNPFVTSIGGKVAWSALSDARAKEEIRDLGPGLEFVLKLRPVSYRLKHGNGRTDMGFLAQDVEALLGEGFNVVDVGRDSNRTLSLRYTDLVAPLVKAVQEQQGVIDDLRTRLARLEALLTAGAR